MRGGLGIKEDKRGTEKGDAQRGNLTRIGSEGLMRGTGRAEYEKKMGRRQDLIDKRN